MTAEFSSFFARARGDASAPFPYQERLATRPWPELLDVPTGLGKTAAIVLAWAYKRARRDPDTPRRLVYCLPMRSLVEQTAREARDYVGRLGLDVPVHELLGGADATELRAFLDAPETDAILVGTQDMLLSRALNRGYGMSRYQWPIAFGLLHNDALWAFDETQLMGVGVETSAQLEGLRRKLGTVLPSRSLWLSATLGRAQLDTVDHPAPASGFETMSLTSDDLAVPVVQKRVGSRKLLERSGLSIPTKASELAAYARSVADAALRVHVSGTRTLIVVNRVARAQAIHEALRRALGSDERVCLVHSRFRAADRREAETRMRATADGFVVATQAIEAGIDISSARLVTEVAPWSSLVQRLGRLNRYGECEDARCVLIDADPSSEEACLPYETAELAAARDLTTDLSEVGPGALREIRYDAPRVVRPVLRRKDLIDLFDTTPELLGNDLDVARFVRDGADADVRVYWRSFDGPPTPALAMPTRDELCAISFANARALLERLDKAGKGSAAFVWDASQERFRPVHRAVPGQVWLLPVQAGGYHGHLGFTGDPSHVPSTLVLQGGAEAGQETLDADPATMLGTWVPLSDHLAHVEAAAREIVARLGLDERLADAVRRAARWHDVGKAHPVFQAMLGGNRATLWAKSDGRRGRSPRPGFRHEWASALALLQSEQNDDTDLVAYLVAAHHGKVRLSVRASEHELHPGDARVFARGVWDGDDLPDVALGDGVSLPAMRLDTSPVRLGAGSWLERTTALRDDPRLGPFVLTLLEALVRLADARASRDERVAANLEPALEVP